MQVFKKRDVQTDEYFRNAFKECQKTDLKTEFQKEIVNEKPEKTIRLSRFYHLKI